MVEEVRLQLQLRGMVRLDEIVRLFEIHRLPLQPVERVERIDAVPLWLQPQLPLAEMVEIVQVQPQLAETCEMFQRAEVETVPLRLQLVLSADWTEELSQACRLVSIDWRIDRESEALWEDHAAQSGRREGSHSGCSGPARLRIHLLWEARCLVLAQMLRPLQGLQNHRCQR